MKTTNQSADIHAELGKYILTDGFDIAFDLESSAGCWIADGRTGERYLDLFSFFASLPLGFNHPVFADPELRERLVQAALHKVSNSDAYTEAFASFVGTFGEVAVPPEFRHLFFIEGGALAVENAMKVAFDWKIRKNVEIGRGELGSKILHLREAFHGRTGYTLSVTNTDPVKTAYFPKFDWPRIPNPKIRFPVDDAETARLQKLEKASLDAIEAAFRDYPYDIAAILLEPIQGEGGDNHFRPEFLRALREIADREDVMLIFDEVQTGFGLTGKFWAYQHFGVTPDLVAFGKKSQVCGVMATARVDEVKDNVFEKSSRINSTWGGNLVDMVRCQAILETIRNDDLVTHAATTGAYLLERLQELDARHELISNVRGRGLMCALDLPDEKASHEVVRRCYEEKVLILNCGVQSVRFRPTLTTGREEIDFAIDVLDRVFQAMA